MYMIGAVAASSSICIREGEIVLTAGNLSNKANNIYPAHFGFLIEGGGRVGKVTEERKNGKT